MGQRGSNSFKRNDAIRVLQTARDGGLEPAMMEVILGPDGTTTFRVYGDKAAAGTTQEAVSAKEWDAEIAKLKAETPKGRRK